MFQIRYNALVRILNQKTCLDRKGTDYEIIITKLHSHNVIGVTFSLAACTNVEPAQEVDKKSSITKEETEEEGKY